MTEFTFLGGSIPTKKQYLKLKQNKEIIQLIKFIINPMAELDRTISGNIQVWTDDKGKDIGTCYKGKNGVLLFVKDFVATHDQLFPEITDRHLKMLIHLLEQDEPIVIFSVAKFNNACALKKSSRGAKRHYELLDDLLKFQIAYSKEGEQIKDANKKDYIKHQDEITFKSIILLKTITYNMTEKELNVNGLTITKTEVTTKLAKAKLELCDIFTSPNRGLMYYHEDLLKLKQNPRVKLGAVSIAFNIYYLASVNSKKKQDNKAVYNASTVLNWVGVYESKYYNFFEKSKKRGVSYFIDQLNTYFKDLEDLHIHAKFINIETDVKSFYEKTQIEFDISDLKNYFK